MVKGIPMDIGLKQNHLGNNVINIPRKIRKQCTLAINEL